MVHVLHIGRYFHGMMFSRYYGYFSDIALPFGYYFLLCATEHRMPLYRDWRMKSMIVFFLPSIAETFQYFGFPCSEPHSIRCIILCMASALLWQRSSIGMSSRAYSIFGITTGITHRTLSTRDHPVEIGHNEARSVSFPIVRSRTVLQMIPQHLCRADSVVTIQTVENCPPRFTSLRLLPYLTHSPIIIVVPGNTVLHHHSFVR